MRQKSWEIKALNQHRSGSCENISLNGNDPTWVDRARSGRVSPGQVAWRREETELME